MDYDYNILKEITETLLEVKEKIAVAESVTSGLLQNALSQIPNATNFYQGGVTTYTPDIKIKLLEVDPEEAERENCVSPHIAEVMAENARKLFEADWAMAITGYAKPVPESNQKLYAYYCIIHGGEVVTAEKINLPESLSPLEAQTQYVEIMLKDLVFQIRNYVKKMEM